MRRDEVLATGDLLGWFADDLIGRVEQLHEAIARRPIAATAPGSTPVSAIHDAIAGGIYGGLRRGAGAAARRGARLIAQTRPPDAPELSTLPRGSLALGALNGLRGDELERDQSALAIPLAVRVDGRDVEPVPSELEAAFGDATPKIAVFAHGLCETDASWGLGESEPYGPRMRRDLGYTPVVLRYNSGLHISDNGRRVARLLEELVEAWPERVEEIALIGHSMGGLIFRSACHYAVDCGHRWVRDVRHVFYLGSPHLGAPLERAVNAAAWALAKTPEARPISGFLRLRSAGIRDLRHGYCIDEEWEGRDPDEVFESGCLETPLLETANHYALSGSLAGAAGLFVGDWLVRPASAHGRGRGRRVAFEEDKARHFDGISHFGLLNNPDVYAQIRDWLAVGTLPGRA